MSSLQIKIGIEAAALSHDPREAAVRARNLDIGGLLFRATSSAIDLTGMSVSGLREFRHVGASQRRSLIGLRCEASNKGLAFDAAVDRDIRRIARAMETAAGLQSPMICLDLGPLPNPPPGEVAATPAVSSAMAGLILLPDPTPVSSTPPPLAQRIPADDAAEAQLDGVLAELGRSADRFGVTVAMRSDLSTMQALERAIIRSGCPWFGVELDPVNVIRDDTDMDKTFSRLGSLVRHVRARDANLGAGNRTAATPLGQGRVNWPEFLAKLDDAGYAGWITIDPVDLPDRMQAVNAALSVLRTTS